MIKTNGLFKSGSTGSPRGITKGRRSRQTSHRRPFSCGSSGAPPTSTLCPIRPHRQPWPAHPSDPASPLSRPTPPAPDPSRLGPARAPRLLSQLCLAAVRGLWTCLAPGLPRRWRFCCCCCSVGRWRRPCCPRGPSARLRSPGCCGRRDAPPAPPSSAAALSPTVDAVVGAPRRCLRGEGGRAPAAAPARAEARARAPAARSSLPTTSLRHNRTPSESQASVSLKHFLRSSPASCSIIRVKDRSGGLRGFGGRAPIKLGGAALPAAAVSPPGSAGAPSASERSSFDRLSALAANRRAARSQEAWPVRCELPGWSARGLVVAGAHRVGRSATGLGKVVEAAPPGPPAWPASDRHALKPPAPAWDRGPPPGAAPRPASSRPPWPSGPWPSP